MKTAIEHDFLLPYSKETLTCGMPQHINMEIFLNEKTETDLHSVRIDIAWM